MNSHVRIRKQDTFFFTLCHTHCYGALILFVENEYIIKSSCQNMDISGIIITDFINTLLLDFSSFSLPLFDSEIIDRFKYCCVNIVVKFRLSAQGHLQKRNLDRSFAFHFWEQ